MAARTPTDGRPARRPRRPGSGPRLEESERRRRTAEALAALAGQTSAAEPQESVLARVLEYAEALLAADVTYLAIREPGAQAAPIAVARGHRQPEFAALELRPGEGISGRVMLEGRPFRTADYLADPRISRNLDDLIRAEGVTAVLAVPVYVGGQVAGVLWAGRRLPSPFAEEEELLLGQLAAQAAVALGNLWLYREAQAAQRRFQDLVEGLDAVVWEADAATWRFRFVSRHAELLLGHPVSRWLTEPGFWIGLIHPQDRERAAALCRKASEQAEDQDFECRFVRSDGRIVWLRNIVRAVTHAEGPVRQLRGVMVDITGQMHAAEALRESEARLQAILDNSPAMIYVKDTAGRYLLVNRRFDVLVRCAPGPVLGRTDHELFPGPLADAFRGNDLKVLAAGAPLEFEELAPHPDGLHTSITIKFPLTDASGTVYATCGISTDITARKQAEEALRESEERLRQGQRMEAIGQLAGGIAHDINNVLTAIIGYSELVLGRLDRDDPAVRDVAEIKRAADRGNDLVRQVLAFSRRQVLQPTVLDLNAVVAELNTMLGRLIGEHVELSTMPAPELGRVRADRSQIEQVLTNLVVNARDAMPTGGRVVIETANVELREADVRRHPVGEAGRYVLLAVSDTGCGMDAATQARIFEPFFTTKPHGKGTGLGLATVYGIVKQSGGYVWVYSEPGRGTTFKIYLPRLDEATEPGREPRPVVASPSARGPETILLVEDDESVRTLTRRTLEDVGYRVLEAPGGDEALGLYESHAGAIVLVLTDVVMPGTGGRALAQALRARRPDLKILYMSGYADNAALRQGHLEAGAAFLGKPFTPTALLQKVRGLLDAPQARAGAQP